MPVYLLIFLMLISAAKVTHAVNDTLVVSNGDVLVGEIKSMDRGVLIMETDYSDSDFNIDWYNVAGFYSQRNFIIKLSAGERYYGTLQSYPENSGEILIKEAGIEHRSRLTDVVYLAAVKKDFLSRLSASIDLGFSFAKANSLRQFSTSTSVGYVTVLWSTNASFDAVRNAQDNADETKRTNASTRFRYFFLTDWFLHASAEFLQNDEQKLKLRATPSVGIGKYFIHSNRLHFGGLIGAAWTNEAFNDSAQTTRNSAEGVTALELNIFNMGDLSLLTNAVVYPSMTEKRRIRADFKFDIKYDLPLEFYIRFGYTHNYDNKPVEGAAESDFVLQTSFGWEL